MNLIDSPKNLIDSPSSLSAAIASSRLGGSTAGSDPRLEAMAEELAQAVSRGDVSREQADAFLGRLSARVSAL